MVSLQESQPHSSKLLRHSPARSMRTIRSPLSRSFPDPSFANPPEFLSENLTDSVVDMHLSRLASRFNNRDRGIGGPDSSKLSCLDDPSAAAASDVAEELLELSRSFSDFSSSSASDISGELRRLASLVPLGAPGGGDREQAPDSEIEPCLGFLQRESFSTEIIESISPEDLQPTVKLCVDALRSPSIAIQRSAAAKLRLLAKNRSDNRLLIVESGAVPALIPLLKSPDPLTQEHAVTALLNLSLHEDNKPAITQEGAIKPMVYALKTGTDVSKQNAACALMSLAMVEENKRVIGLCGAIPLLVSLLINGTNRGKKDALTTLYKVCSEKENKERAVRAGVVGPLIGMIANDHVESELNLKEKAMAVLGSLAGYELGREAIVEGGGITALVEVMEGEGNRNGGTGMGKAKELAIVTLLQLCSESARNRSLLVREGGIPPLVALSQSGGAKAKLKAEKLLGYLRETRHGASSSSP
ncbi:hypothetical protein MLD38_019442 [Melastoma candidum]|uniref:Uncharacterized protein n=1 Tax=Melastoma candidum TaxID=119954 RepID=A0ACB9QW52_9MYRT|nr:hypothetical protein MLD38_019442 [Melastoma candidum]